MCCELVDVLGDGLDDIMEDGCIEDGGGGKQISIAQLLDPDNLICLRIYTCCEEKGVMK